ncbi:hypothetical protein [Streptomyces sp. NPDC047981]|uniref:hypothetical protein n=1 Tax=Streptomyces sp. NPDC047981 TaxID=3154610 RepID=UPI00343225CE
MNPSRRKTSPPNLASIADQCVVALVCAEELGLGAVQLAGDGGAQQTYRAASCEVAVEEHVLSDFDAVGNQAVAISVRAKVGGGEVELSCDFGVYEPYGTHGTELCAEEHVAADLAAVGIK